MCVAYAHWWHVIRDAWWVISVHLFRDAWWVYSDCFKESIQILFEIESLMRKKVAKRIVSEKNRFISESDSFGQWIGLVSLRVLKGSWNESSLWRIDSFLNMTDSDSFHEESLSSSKETIQTSDETILLEHLKRFFWSEKWNFWEHIIRNDSPKAQKNRVFGGPIQKHEMNRKKQKYSFQNKVFWIVSIRKNESDWVIQKTLKKHGTDSFCTPLLLPRNNVLLCKNKPTLKK